MLTERGARTKLKKWGIDLSPLQPSNLGTSILLVPAPDARRVPEADWHGDVLARVLQSARVEGERVLGIFDNLLAEINRYQSTNGNVVAPQVIANQTLKENTYALQEAWKELSTQAVEALRQDTVAREITSLITAFYDKCTTLKTDAEEIGTGQIERLEALAASGSVRVVEQGSTLDTSSASEDARQSGARQANCYPVHTSQEWTAILHTASDGKYERNFTADESRGVLRHQRPDAPFYTETILTEEEQRMNMGLELLRQAASELDLDDCYVWLYISNLITPVEALKAGNYAGGWIDLDDVARKTLGGYAPNPAEAQKRRRKVWHAIRYGARAFVGGQRTVPYFDKTTGKEIETKIYATPWQVVSRQQAVQPSLFNDDDSNMPARVELVASREWTQLTTAPSTAQFLPMGEMLGGIPPSKPSGAWARALGLAYMHWCRLHLHEALEGGSPPSRRELLDQFPTKLAPYEQILNSEDPGRALKYWHGAEEYLIEVGFIEGIRSVRPKSRKGWKEAWLAESPPWRPGPSLTGILQSLSTNQFTPKPRDLSRPRRTRKKAN